MSNKFVIVSDSTTDLPVELANEIELVVIPLSVHIGDKTYVNYLDEREIKTKDFYDQVMNGALPTTSQVNPTDYEDTSTQSFVDLYNESIELGIEGVSVLNDFLDGEREVFDDYLQGKCYDSGREEGIAMRYFDSIYLKK